MFLFRTKRGRVCAECAQSVRRVCAECAQSVRRSVSLPLFGRVWQGRGKRKEDTSVPDPCRIDVVSPLFSVPFWIAENNKERLSRPRGKSDLDAPPWPFQEEENSKDKKRANFLFVSRLSPLSVLLTMASPDNSCTLLWRRPSTKKKTINFLFVSSKNKAVSPFPPYSLPWRPQHR
jgi:hypothetical protein